MPQPNNDHITLSRATEIPPKINGGRRPTALYTTAAAEAVKHPAEWVVLSGYKSSATANNMRQGKYPAIDPDDFDIESRRNPDGVRYDVYLRYVGKIVER